MKEGWNSEQLLQNFQLFFIVKLNLELYERPEPLVEKVVAASL